MKALVVYESFWGNTAAVARAVAEGIGPGAQVLPTGEATLEAIAGVELLVAGSPVVGFRMPTDEMRESLRHNPGRAPASPDLSQPSLRSWLERLPEGGGCCAAFDTRVRGPFGSAAPEISKVLQRKGFRLVAKPVGFIVAGKFGPMRPGELARARQWGESLGALTG